MFPGGKNIRISQPCEKQGVILHFVYLYEDNYYDINGKAASIESLMSRIDYFDISKDFQIDVDEDAHLLYGMSIGEPILKHYKQS